MYNPFSPDLFFLGLQELQDDLGQVRRKPNARHSWRRGRLVRQPGGAER